MGASNLGHIILYALLNQQDGLLCDRAYYPGEDLQVRTVCRLTGEQSAHDREGV